MQNKREVKTSLFDVVDYDFFLIIIAYITITMITMIGVRVCLLAGILSFLFKWSSLFTFYLFYSE